jgi:hypothetical protein
VLSVDEKSQIQALDRTQPGLPMKKGRAGTMTHDYKRHGVTTLFAALDVLEGKVIGQCMKHHRHQEFIRFLTVIDVRVPKKKTVHVSLPNSPKSASSAACSDPSKNSKTPSTTSSTTSMQTQSPLPGPRTPTKSSQPSNEGTKS